MRVSTGSVRSSLFFFLLLATSLPARADATAVQITSPAQLLPGTNAQGVVGDWLLANDHVRVVIDDISRPHGFANTGGNILDAATAAGEDRFASLFTMFDNRFGRQANYATIEIVDAGGGAGTARIRVTGVDSTDGNIAVTTEYALGPADRFVRIQTTLTNNGTALIRQLQVGDAIQWGLTEHFAPGRLNTNRNVLGDGYDIGGLTFSAPWVAGNGQGSSYGVTVLSGTLEISNGSSWSDANVTYLDLTPGGGFGSYTRYFLIGDGSLSSISDIAFGLRSTATGTLSGAVTENVTGLALPGIEVVINTGACLGASGSSSYTIARTDAGGQYSARLEPNTYHMLFRGVGRATPACQTLAVSAPGAATLDQVMGRQGFLSWEVRDAAADLLPAKISALYEPPTARFEGPTLGDRQSLVGGYSILSPTGAGTTAIPPGTYRFYVSRGVEYEPSVQVLTVAEAGTTSLAATLNRVVDSGGYVSADMHVHGFNSADSAITWEDRVREAAAEGLEIVVPTDHDYISELQPARLATGLGAFVNGFPGNEVTTNTWGHFNAYPLTPDTGAPRNGALDHAGMAPGQIFSALRSDPKEPVVQVNHPRAGGLGYFDLTALNPVTGTSFNPDFSFDFDALEVFNGKRLYQIPLVLNDWYRLLNNGRRVLGVGNTDTHQIFSQELGYPRNFVYTGGDDPAAVTETQFRDALRSARSFLTNGPFVETWVHGTPMGGLRTDTTGSVPLRVKVQAPAFMTVDTVRILVNGKLAQTVTLAPASGTVLRLDEVYPLTITRDSWIAVEVTGGQCGTDASNNCLVAGCPGRLDPIVPPLYGTDPVCPYAHTNPVFIDFDNDGLFDAPGNQGLRIEPIAATRAVDGGSYLPLREGEVVTVRGVVTADSYTYDHRNNAVPFQDGSIDTVNKISGGAYIFQSGLILPLTAGSEIEVTGTIDTFNGLYELTGVSTTVLRTDAAVPDPLVVTIADITNAANREQWESMLVRVNNATITSGTWPAFGVNSNITVNDGTGSMTMRIDSDTNIDGGPQPVGTFDLVATLGQFDSSAPHTSGYQLLPRSRDDIVEAGSALTILHRPAADPVASCSAQVRWYTNKAADSRVEYGTSPAYGTEVGDAALVTAHSVALTGLMPGTTYHYRVTSGGVSSPGQTFTTPPSAVPALQAGPLVNFVDDTTVQIRWTTDLPSTSVVRYGTSGAYGSTASGAGGTRFHYVTISGLAQGTTYHYQVESLSGACGGGLFTGADLIFTTPTSPLAPPEVSPPGSLVPFTLERSGSGGIRFRFEFRGEAYRYHIYGVDSEAQLDAGAWPVKLCDLATNTAGTFATDFSTFVTFTVADGALLPASNYVVVAEEGGVEGSYGTKSSLELRTRDLDQKGEIEIGCSGACLPASAMITGVEPSTTVSRGTQQTFNGIGNGEGAVTLEWDFDYDGTSFDVQASGGSVTYTYPATGSYTAALRITDSCTNPGPQSALDTEAITITEPACGPLVVISQVYGGGGNSGATYRNDFIELFNRGDAPQDVTGWSVQYASSSGSTWQVTTLSGTIPPGGYYLVQEAQGAGGTTNLPTPDATGTIAMSGTSGKVALSSTSAALGGSCPLGGTVVDFVGYGTANCFEGAGATPTLSNTTSASRDGAGCEDTTDNAADFTAGPVNPRNSASPANVCACP